MTNDAFEPASWLESLYRLYGPGIKDDQAVGEVFRTLERLIHTEDLAGCGAALRMVDLDRLSVTVMLALLSITAPAKDSLPARAGLVTEIEKRLRVLAPDRCDALLRFLR